LGGFAAFYMITWLSAIGRKREGEPSAPGPILTGIGFVTNFFDTLGIGSFATTTSFFKVMKLVKDEVIPGTLNVGHTLPTIVQAFIYISIIKVDMTTLILMIAASVLGAWLGAGVVAGWSRRNVQIGMGCALLAAAVLLLLKIFSIAPAGAGTYGLEGSRLVIGLAGNFMLGALMSLGIGLYAPCLILVSFLGMVETTAFPIMMGSCAFLMPVSSAEFIRKKKFDLKATIGLSLGGIPAVLIAAYIVKNLDLYYVRWLVVFVVVYTAISMLRSAMVERQAAVAKQAA
ncbi:MAG TPA: permease, partial [Blastocatellia bacterium]|nr:permease [Blastocatellia bacterium]